MLEEYPIQEYMRVSLSDTMDIDTFKQRYSAELDGLTLTRVNTLWKKSKTLNQSELVTLIKQSQVAQSKQKRGKDAIHQTSEASVSSEPTQLQVVEVEKSMVGCHNTIDVISPVKTPDEWLETCVRLGIDHVLLVRKVESLHGRVRRIDDLHSAVNDLLSLRERCGSEVDVLGMLP